MGFASNALGGAGGPLAVLFVAIIAAEFGKAVSKETKSRHFGYPHCDHSHWRWGGLDHCAPHRRGSQCLWAAHCADYQAPALLDGHAGVGAGGHCPDSAYLLGGHLFGLGVSRLGRGAAVAGCCANMVGFAVLSFKENGWGGLVSQGIGTSMLQMPNIVKNPKIWLPAILTSAITGPIATCLFKLEMNGAPINSGMGTCGLCGQLGVWTGWVAPSEKALASGAVAITPTAFDWVGLILISFVLPAVLCWLFGIFFRKIGWIKEGDLQLS